MRINVNDANGPRVRNVFLNGQKIKDCFELDDEEGWVDVYDIQAVEDNPDLEDFPTKRLHGAVTFDLLPGQTLSAT